MLNFKFIKMQLETDGGININRLYHASSYQGGILLRTTTILGSKSVSSNITNLPMAEIYEISEGQLDIRMCVFNLQQIGMDIGIDLGGNDQNPKPFIEEMTSVCEGS